MEKERKNKPDRPSGAPIAMQRKVLYLLDRLDAWELKELKLVRTDSGILILTTEAELIKIARSA